MSILLISVENDAFEVPINIANKSGYISNAINAGMREVNEGFQTTLTTEKLEYFVSLLLIDPFTKDNVLNKLNIDRKLLSNLFELEWVAEYFQIPELQSILYEAIYKYISGPMQEKIDRNIIQHIQHNFDRECDARMPKGSYVTFFRTRETGERADRNYINVALFTHPTMEEAKLNLAKYLAGGYARKAANYGVGRWNIPLEFFNMEMRRNISPITEEILTELENLSKNSNAELIFGKLEQYSIATTAFQNNIFSVTDLNADPTGFSFLSHVFAENTGAEYSEFGMAGGTVYITYVSYDGKIQDIDTQQTIVTRGKIFDRITIPEQPNIRFFREIETGIIFFGSEQDPNTPLFAYGIIDNGNLRGLTEEERTLVTSWGFFNHTT